MTDTSAPAAVIGQAEATTAGRKTAWQMHMDYKKKSDEPYSAFFELEMESHNGKPDENDLKGETVTVELIGLQMCLIEEDVKNKSNPAISTSTETLAQCFGQVKKEGDSKGEMPDPHDMDRPREALAHQHAQASPDRNQPSFAGRRRHCKRSRHSCHREKAQASFVPLVFWSL